MKTTLFSKTSLVALWLLMFLSFGCAESNESGGGGDSADAVDTSTSLDMTITALRKQKIAGSSQTLSAMAMNSVGGTLLQGEMLVENIDTSNQETHDWSIYLNEDTFAAESNKTIVLEPGNYRFSLLVTHGDQQYAGISTQIMTDGENTITMTVRPVIGDTVAGVEVVSELADFKFQYNASELSAAGIANPNIGIIVNGGLEEILAINPATGISDDYLNLPQGEHTIELKLYDGSLQKGKSITSQQTVQVAPGYDIAMDLIALHGEGMFSLTEDGGDANFRFVVPSDVVDEAGGTGNLTTLFSIVGAKNSLRENELSLSEDASGDYVASITHSGFQADEVTLSLAFSQGSELLGSCTQIATIDTTPRDLLCDLSLRRRAVAGGDLLATLAINVMDKAGKPIVGATVYNGSTVLGITGSNAFGNDGFLKINLNAGNYTLRAETEDKIGVESLNLVPLSANNLDVTLSAKEGYAFKTVWKTDNTGNTVSASNQVKLPLDSDGTYDFIVDWGDGNQDVITSYNQSETIHSYSTSGTYTLTVEGQIEGFGFAASGQDSSKIVDVLNWGPVKLHNKGDQFHGCDKLTGFSATDTPDLSGVTSMRYMFSNASVFNGDLSNWDISNVTNTLGMFSGASAFSSDLSSWDVSNVTDTRFMFSDASVFNSDLSSWNVSNVTDMTMMFSGASLFNGDLSSWNVTGVRDMGGMFQNAASFNGDISSWNVSSVEDMGGMFNGASSFNGDLSTWNVSNVTNMVYAFQNATAFNGDLSSWDVSNVTDMQSMFNGASVFSGDLSTWNTSSVTNMYGMFNGASAFNSNLSSWNVSNVTNMQAMFQEASAFDGNLTSWNVSSVTNMQATFWDATAFNGDISSWNVSSVTNMSNMFRNATAFNGDLSSWNVSNAMHMIRMFENASVFNQNLSGWCVTNISSAPYGFGLGTLMDSAFYPVWGTCPP